MASNDCLGWSEIMVASRSGNRTDVKNYFENGSDLCVSNSYGYSPLALAIVSKDYQTFNYIFQIMLATYIEKLKEDKVAFGIACYTGDPKLVQTLLESGLFNINEPVLYGLTPILLAASNGCIEVAKVLLEAGANKYATNLLAQNSYDVAVYRKDTKMQALLSDKLLHVPVTPLCYTPCFSASPICTTENTILKRTHNNMANSKSCSNLTKVNLNKKFKEIFEPEEAFKENANHSYCKCHFLNSLLSPQYLHSNTFNGNKSSKSLKQGVAFQNKQNVETNKCCIPWTNRARNLFKRTPKKMIMEITKNKENYKMEKNLRITQVLTKLNLEEYISAFITHEVDADMILNVTTQDLKEIGITDEAKCSEILNNIMGFKEKFCLQ